MADLDVSLYQTEDIAHHAEAGGATEMAGSELGPTTPLSPNSDEDETFFDAESESSAQVNLTETPNGAGAVSVASLMEDAMMEEETFLDCREQPDTSLPSSIQAEDSNVQPLIAPPLPPTAEPTAAITLSSYFEDQALMVLKETNSTLLQKIASLNVTLTTANENLLKLAEHKQQETELNEKLSKLQKIFSSEAKNVLALWTENSGTFDEILESSSQTEKNNWLGEKGRFAQLNSTNSLWSMISRDDENRTCLFELKKLAVERYEALAGKFDRQGALKTEGEIQSIQAEQNKCIAQLAGNNQTAKMLLEQVTIHEIRLLSQTNRALFNLLTTCEPLVTEVIRNEEKLKSISHLDKTINIFLQEHTTFIVKLSLFLARYISSIFKTETANKIEQVTEMQSKLLIWTTHYQTILDTKLSDISDKLVGLKDKTDISNNFKSIVSEQLTTPIVEPVPEPEPEPEQSIIGQFNRIQTLFNPLKPPTHPIQRTATPAVRI